MNGSLQTVTFQYLDLSEDTIYLLITKKENA